MLNQVSVLIVEDEPFIALDLATAVEEAGGKVIGPAGSVLAGFRRENRSGPMATGKQLKAAILARRAAKGPRKKRTRPKPRQYTIADLERARDRVAAAERRIDNDRTNNPNRGRAGLERAQLELSVIEFATTLARPP